MVDFNRFNQGSRIFIPGDHLGDPFKLPGVDKNPFDDLDAISGCNDSDPDLARIGDLTREVQRGVQAITLLTHGKVNDQDPDVIFPFIEDQVRRRIGERLFYVGADTGEDFFQARVGMGILQNIGSCESGICGELKLRREMALDMSDRHEDFLMDFLECQRGEIILETGAGSDYGRLNGMAEYARSVGGRLICHDTAPLASRLGSSNLKEVPFLALPSSAEILSLPLADSKRPKTITLKDVVSSMAFGQIDEIGIVAENIGARKIVVTQSLGLAGDTSNMIPEGWRAKEPKYIQYLKGKIVEFLLRSGTKKPNENFFLIISMQIQHVIDLVMMELAKRYMKMGVTEFAGMNKDRIINVEEHSSLDNEQAGRYLSEFFPNLLGSFMSGNFNKLVIGPFGIHLIKDFSIKRGLTVASIRSHWEFSKENFAELNTKKRKVTVGMADRVTIPREFLSIGKEYALSQIRAAGIEDHTLENDLRREYFRELTRVGSAIALELIFDVWGRTLGHPYLRPFLGTRHEQEIRSAFLK